MILHEFTMSDCEDPYLYAGFPISEWQATDKGKWVMANVIDEPILQISPDIHNFGYRVVISGNLNPMAETYFRLKYK